MIHLFYYISTFSIYILIFDMMVSDVPRLIYYLVGEAGPPPDPCVQWASESISLSFYQQTFYDSCPCSYRQVSSYIKNNYINWIVMLDFYVV